MAGRRTQKTQLRLDLRDDGVHRITSNVWGAFAEAAAVVLDQYHAAPPPPKACKVIVGFDQVERAATLEWEPSTELSRDTHANQIDAIHWGAYAVAACAVHAVHGWRIVARAQHATGADWIMMPDGDPETFVRVEVSGIGNCPPQTARRKIAARLAQKVDQLNRGADERFGLAAVFGFEAVEIALSEIQEK